MTLEEAYGHLEIHSSADEATVKSAYKKMALRTHPDKNPNDPDARHRFQKVSEAYKRITDPDSFKDEEDDEEAEMDMDELNQMLFSMFEDMIPMMMGGGFNPSRMSGGAINLFDLLSAGMDPDMFDEDDEDGFDDEYGFAPDGDLEDVMAMMMGGMLGGPPRRGRGGNMDEMMFMEQMMMGMGAGPRGGKAGGPNPAWLDGLDDSPSKKKKTRKKKKKKKAKSAQDKDEDEKWETDSEEERGPPPSAKSKAKAAAGSKAAKSSKNSEEAEMEAMLMAMMMAAGGSSAGMDGLFSEMPRATRSVRAPAAAAPALHAGAGKKPNTSKLSSDEEDEEAGYGNLYEEGDVVVVNKRY